MAMFSEDFELFNQLKKEEHNAMIDKLLDKLAKVYRQRIDAEDALHHFDRAYKAQLDAENRNTHFQRSLAVGYIQQLDEEYKTIDQRIADLDGFWF